MKNARMTSIYRGVLLVGIFFTAMYRAKFEVNAPADAAGIQSLYQVDGHEGSMYCLAILAILNLLNLWSARTSPAYLNIACLVCGFGLLFFDECIIQTLGAGIVLVTLTKMVFKPDTFPKI